MTPGSSGPPPPNIPPIPDDELEEELPPEVIFRPPPPGSLIAKVSPSLSEKSFFGPVGRCGDGPSSMSVLSSSLEGFEARLAAAF